MAMEEDRNEAQLSTDNDCAWIRGIDNSGNSIKISKADLVEVIRANMPIATSSANGIMSVECKSLIPNQIWRTGRYKSMKIANVNPYISGVMIIAESGNSGRSGGLGILFVSNTSNGSNSIFYYYTLGSTHSASEDGYLSTPVYTNSLPDGTTDIFVRSIEEQHTSWFRILNLCQDIAINMTEQNIPSTAVNVPQTRFAFQ